MNQLDITDTCGLSSNMSRLHILPKFTWTIHQGHILGLKIHLHNLKKYISHIMSCSQTTLELNQKPITERYLGESPNSWRVNNAFLNNTWSRKKSPEKLKTILN
jgi:hypothetical protein